MIHGHEGTTQLLTLTFEGETGNGARLAIIRELQFDPVSDALLHVDLQEVSADRAITVRVAVRPVGEAAGVRDQKGILNLVLHELEVSCLPTAIPQRIDADVSALMIGNVLTVRELVAPAGVRILNDPGQAVATVAPPMAEEAPVVAATATTSDRGVILQWSPAVLRRAFPEVRELMRDGRAATPRRRRRPRR